jgi:hypothetical protein
MSMAISKHQGFVCRKLLFDAAARLSQSQRSPVFTARRTAPAAALITALLLSLPIDAQSFPSNCVEPTPFTQKKFVIATWWDPPILFQPNNASFDQDLESFRTASRAHFNLLTATQERQGQRIWSQEENDYRLDLAARVGLTSLVADDRYNWQDNPGTRYNATAAFGITNHYTCLATIHDETLRDAIYGYFTLHEPCLNETQPGWLCPPRDVANGQPGPANVDYYRAWLQHFKIYDPEKIAFVILLPYQGQGANLYEEYLGTFLNGPTEDTTPDVVAFDLYPFGKNGFYPWYYYNISTWREKAGTRPLWQWVLATNENSSSDAQYLDDPDENQLRFQVFNPIAYGARGIGYYTYSPVLPPTNQFSHPQALIDENGNTTAKYDMIATINYYLEQIVGPAVMASKHLGAFHKSTQPTGEALPAESLISSATPLIRDVNDQNVLVGVFEGAEAQYGLVVNKKITPIQNVRVTLKCDCRSRVSLAPSVVGYQGETAYLPLDAQYDPSSNTTSFVIDTLAGGEGRLFRVSSPGPAVIQSNFGGNFELVVPQWDPDQQTQALCHWWRDNAATATAPYWHKSVCFGRDVVGSPAFIQSKPSCVRVAGGRIICPLGRMGNFEVVVPQWDAENQKKVLCHWWRDNDINTPEVSYPWHKSECFTDDLGLAPDPALIQSNFGQTIELPGNFEVVVQGVGGQLCHYWRDNNAAGFPWQKSECFSDEVTSGPALIQSHFSNQALGIQGNFEVVVNEFGQLCHYWRNNDVNTPDVSYPWTKTYCFGSDITSAPTMIQNTFSSNGINVGDFEVMVRKSANLCRYTRDNTATLEWYVPEVPEANGCFDIQLSSKPGMTESRRGSFGHFEGAGWLSFQDGDHLFASGEEIPGAMR